MGTFVFRKSWRKNPAFFVLVIVGALFVKPKYQSFTAVSFKVLGRIVVLCFVIFNFFPQITDVRLTHLAICLYSSLVCGAEVLTLLKPRLTCLCGVWTLFKRLYFHLAVILVQVTHMKGGAEIIQTLLVIEWPQAATEPRLGVWSCENLAFQRTRRSYLLSSARDLRNRQHGGSCTSAHRHRPHQSR